MHLKKYSIEGERPDFYCDTLTRQFAVEAKGYSSPSISDNQMIKHKDQSETGPLSVNFSVASVAYNLYNEPKIKFYDPIGDNASYDYDLNSQLRALYYLNALRFIEELSYFRTLSEFSDYYAYNISYPFFPPFRFLVHKKQ